MADQYVDFDIYGRQKSNGELLELYNEEATKNALISWFTSKKGDYVENPEAGGILDRAQFKNIDNTGILVFALKNALLLQFAPVIGLKSIDLDKNYETRTLNFLIEYYDLNANKEQNVVIATKDFTPTVIPTVQNIPYTGENLKMYCLMRKSDLPNDLLIYDENESVWKWGTYLFFVNLTEDDAYFNDILEICNG